MSIHPDDPTALTSDPVAQLLLTGKAQTLHDAEELYLDSCLPEVLRLLESGLSDEELGQHPLMCMLRPWEPPVGGGR